MVANIANNIIFQLDQLPNGQQIKRLLFLKLEAELNATRCVIETPPDTIKSDPEEWVEIVE
jgi:hypothetical protein